MWSEVVWSRMVEVVWSRVVEVVERGQGRSRAVEDGGRVLPWLQLAKVVAGGIGQRSSVSEAGLGAKHGNYLSKIQTAVRIATSYNQKACDRVESG